MRSHQSIEVDCCL